MGKISRTWLYAKAMTNTGIAIARASRRPSSVWTSSATKAFSGPYSAEGNLRRNPASSRHLLQGRQLDPCRPNCGPQQEIRGAQANHPHQGNQALSATQGLPLHPRPVTKPHGFTECLRAEDKPFAPKPTHASVAASNTRCDVLGSSGSLGGPRIKRRNRFI